MELPPHISSHDRVILFDGVCKLCNAWANFIIEYDTRQVFRLCSVQSPQGQAILAHFGYPTDEYETMLLVEGSTALEKSAAFLRVMQLMGLPWSSVAVFQLIPAPVRDWLYERIALNRYVLFGRYDVCRLPEPEHAARFLD